MDGWGKHGLPPTSLSLSLFSDFAQRAIQSSTRSHANFFTHPPLPENWQVNQNFGSLTFCTDTTLFNEAGIPTILMQTGVLPVSSVPLISSVFAQYISSR